MVISEAGARALSWVARLGYAPAPVLNGSGSEKVSEALSSVSFPSPAVSPPEPSPSRAGVCLLTVGFRTGTRSGVGPLGSSALTELSGGSRHGAALGVQGRPLKAETAEGAVLQWELRHPGRLLGFLAVIGGIPTNLCMEEPLRLELCVHNTCFLSPF